MSDAKRFFLYARKSTEDEKRQVRSIPAQLAELREIAKRENLTIVDEIEETQTAMLPGRTRFNAMLERIRANEGDGILAWHADRLSRNAYDSSQVVGLLDSAHLLQIRFHGSTVDNTPNGKMMLGIEFGFSKYYVDSLSVNVKRGHREKIRRREHIGIASLGYLNDVRTKNLVLDVERARIIRKAFERYATGSETLESIAEYLGSHGILTRKDKSGPGGRPLAKNRIARLLSNPLYYGHFIWSGEIHEGSHPPLVTKDLFDRVQSILHRRTRVSLPLIQRSRSPFVRLMRCADCRTMVTSEVQKGRTYYRCTKRVPRNGKCTQPYVREDELTAQLASLLTPFKLSSEEAEWMLARVEGERAKAADTARTQVADLRDKLERLEAALERLRNALVDGLINHDEFRNEKSRLLSEKKSTQEKTTSLTRHPEKRFELLQNWILDAKNLGELCPGAPAADVTPYLRKIFGSNLLLDLKKARGVAVKPWSALAKRSGGYTTAHVLNEVRTQFS